MLPTATRFHALNNPVGSGAFTQQAAAIGQGCPTPVMYWLMAVAVSGGVLFIEILRERPRRSGRGGDELLTPGVLGGKCEGIVGRLGSQFRVSGVLIAQQVVDGSPHLAGE